MGLIQESQHDQPPAIVGSYRLCCEHKFKTAAGPRATVPAGRTMPDLGGEGEDLSGGRRPIGLKLRQREDPLGYRAAQTALHKLDARRGRRGGHRRHSGGGPARQSLREYLFPLA